MLASTQRVHRRLLSKKLLRQSRLRWFFLGITNKYMAINSPSRIPSNLKIPCLNFLSSKPMPTRRSFRLRSRRLFRTQISLSKHTKKCASLGSTAQSSARLPSTRLSRAQLSSRTSWAPRSHRRFLRGIKLRRALSFLTLKSQSARKERLIATKDLKPEKQAP